MMHPVHVRRHDDPAQHAVEPARHADVAVIEHRCGVEQHLEDQHGDRGAPSAATTASLMTIDSRISIGWKRSPVVTSKSRSA